ncbi:MAG: diaminopimelate decarboxylase [Fibrobacter sp.]|jgi:diaminopimelate decarboxylase|nr:diaminopimelate decarboxylase [Fibrobacter sp.]
MNYIHNIWTEKTNFFGNTDPLALASKYGTPLYVYNESILRSRCKALTSLISYPAFKVNYSAKANTNLSLLRIIRSEGLTVDAMSAGELFLELKAGFTPEEILLVCNNVSDEELRFAIDAGVLISADSVSQLRRIGQLNRGGKVAVRINPGIGAGHHEKVITGGQKTKFGVDPQFTAELKSILKEFNLHLTGLNQHIGSLFMTPESYIEAASFLLSYAQNFPELQFVDFGGGFGIPYHKDSQEKPLDLKTLGSELQKLIDDFVRKTGKKLTIKIEPGRFIVAECGVLLGRVHALKQNAQTLYAGTDIGFNVLIRPAFYGSHHDIEIYRDVPATDSEMQKVTIVGNICETGDILAKDRTLPSIKENDVIGVLDAGAYGMVMSSNYNCRLRPAEVLIDQSGNDILIRRRDTLEDLLIQFQDLLP